jgi:hypothetical protein
MHEEPTTVVIQRYLDALPGDTAAEPVVGELRERAAGRLRLLCAPLLYKSYPRLARPPVNLETDELLGGVVAGLQRGNSRPLEIRKVPTAGLIIECSNASAISTTNKPSGDTAFCDRRRGDVLYGNTRSGFARSFFCRVAGGHCWPPAP